MEPKAWMLRETILLDKLILVRTRQHYSRDASSTLKGSTVASDMSLLEDRDVCVCLPVRRMKMQLIKSAEQSEHRCV